MGKLLQGVHRSITILTPPFSRTYVDAAGCPFTWWTGIIADLIFWNIISRWPLKNILCVPAAPACFFLNNSLFFQLSLIPAATSPACTPHFHYRTFSFTATCSQRGKYLVKIINGKSGQQSYFNMPTNLVFYSVHFPFPACMEKGAS